MKHTCIIPVVILVVVMFAGCAHDQERIRPAEELFQEAAELAAKGNVEKATDAFMEVRTYYPGHELARKALLSLGDLNYDNGFYDFALRYYEEFRLLFPTDLEAPYALFKIGMCHYQQLTTVDRDQSQTVKTIETFETFLSTYPESPYADEARARLADAQKLLAQHYIYIGKFYLKKKKYEAACRRFQYVRDQYPGLDLDDELDELIQEACVR